MSEEHLRYLSGFDATHQSEALPGALPPRQNSPRRAPYGLYPEQINGVPFTVPRESNPRVWVYRIRPSVVHDAFEPLSHPAFGLGYLQGEANPNLLGWRPRPLPDRPCDFVDGLATFAGAGHPTDGPGIGLHTFVCSAPMRDRAFYDADGEWMILPDTGRLRIRTELGRLEVGPGQLAVVPRGMLASIDPMEGPARGLVAEIYGRRFRLPERGPIGANGLADERHFEVPTAAYEDRCPSDGYTIVAKVGGRLFTARRSHSPFDVVAWHGRYAPYRYDLSLFNAMGTVTWDHPDPSIYTVMSAPLDHPGQNLADLVVFPNPRYDVARDTFRPAFFHRNAATEINSIVTGPTDPTKIFTRGGYFITPPFTAHGVAVETVERQLGMTDELANAPRQLQGGAMWIQFETTLQLRIAPTALTSPQFDPGFRSFAQGVESRFDPSRIDPWS